MTVYVDDMRANFGRMVMCHMIGTDETELHDMASRIGVAHKWYQGDHYDIALSKRVLAISFGAVAISWKQCGLMANNRRHGYPMGTPATCESIARARMRSRSETKGQVL